MNRPPLDKTRNHIALLFHFKWLKIRPHYYFNEIHWGKPHRVAISMKLLEITSRCYFTEVTWNHTALLFQWSYSKVTSRCYFTEVTLISRKSRYLRNASKNEEVNTEIIKGLLALFPFPPLSTESKFNIKDYILLYHSIFLRISLFLGFPYLIRVVFRLKKNINHTIWL